MGKAFRRICGFPLHKEPPPADTFSRFFEVFVSGKLAKRAHEAFIKTHFENRLIEHFIQDGTASEARDRLWKQ